MRTTRVRVLISLLLVLSLFWLGVAQQGGRGFDPANLNRECKACEDFYCFANGGWMAKNPIPAAYSSWGSFNILAERNRDNLHEILEAAAKNSKARKGTNEQRIGAYYASCMDEGRIETDGIKPLEADLKRIDAIKDIKELQLEMARLQKMGVPGFFSFGALPDAKNSTMVIARIGQGGLSLPNRDYYVKEDDKSKQIREAFLQYAAKMFEMTGDERTRAEAEARTIMDIQTKLAQASRAPAELRNPVANYNKMELAQLKQLAPDVAWEAYFAARGLTNLASLNVAQPDFFKAASSLLTTVPLADWKTYLRWQLINSAAPYLSSRFETENFNFYGRTLTGAKEMLPRWRRCVAATDNALGEALGEVYVQKHFTAQDKARMQEMVRNLLAAFRERIMKLDWMSEETRKQSLAKLEAFATKIGYPDKWRDYSRLDIERGSYLENARRAGAFEIQRNMNKIGKPVDRTEWAMTPPTVNAYYTPLYNEIVFPAGILRAPFFSPTADDAINYGGIGAVIGHEITHGFDDSGSQYDPQGNLRNWWTQEDRQKFDQRAGCVINQFSSYEVEKGLNMNGKLVAGESIADLGGLTVAYDAFKKSLAGKPAPADIDGFTADQRFFLGWAQVWATNARIEQERLQAVGDPHPLGRFRVNGPLSNLPAFAKAFGCKDGDPMVRPEKERCQIW